MSTVLTLPTMIELNVSFRVINRVGLIILRFVKVNNYFSYNKVDCPMKIWKQNEVIVGI